MNETRVAQHFPIERFLSPEALEEVTARGYKPAIEEYLKAFALFDDVVLRCRCGRRWATPGTAQSILGFSAFTWGLVHGEGFCSECEWPGRAVHRISVPDRDEPLYFRVPLPYHPDFVEERQS